MVRGRGEEARVVTLLARHAPDAVDAAGVRVKRIGDAFRVIEIPGAPGVAWQACVYPDGKLRPVAIEDLRAVDLR